MFDRKTSADSSFSLLPTLEQRLFCERNATLSTCFGAMGDVTLSDSAIIILFAQMLGAGDMYSMLTTSLLPLFNGLCIIPMAFVAEKTGYQKLILRITMLAAFAYYMVVASPFFGGGKFSVSVMILMLVLFAFCNTGYLAGWYPMLDTFLLPERRSFYLSSMRFSWQLSSAVFLCAAGIFVGENPSLQRLQLVLLIAATLFLGRIFFIARIPRIKAEKTGLYGFHDGLCIALANKPLAGYSVYLFILNLAAYGTLPLATIYLKKHLHAPDNLIVLISGLSMIGMLLGSIGSGRIITRWGIKNTLLGIHITFALVNSALFFIGEWNCLTGILTALLMMAYSFTFAAASIASTSEMMALATPGNKAMAMAFCGTFYYTGSGLSRLISSLVLGSGMLAPQWRIGSMSICHYQTLFLVYSVLIVFAAIFLVVVPAVFPKGEYVYDVH